VSTAAQRFAGEPNPGLAGGPSRFATSFLRPSPPSLEGTPAELKPTDSEFKVSDPAPIKSVVALPAPPRSSPERFDLLQQFVGTVLDVGEETFSARLQDRTDQSRGSEIAEFDLEEVSDFDRDLVQGGAVFYWSIGYRISPSGQRTRVSRIRFRRLPAWSRSDLRDAEQAVEIWGYMLDDSE